LNLTDIKKDDLVLDTGCGNGRFSRYAADLGAVVLAIDNDEKCVNETKKLGIDATVGSIADLPFTDSSFDYYYRISFQWWQII